MTEPEDQSDESKPSRDVHKRFTMKSLGQLVDSNRITGQVQPQRAESSGPHHRDNESPQDDDASGMPTDTATVAPPATADEPVQAHLATTVMNPPVEEMEREAVEAIAESPALDTIELREPRSRAVLGRLPGDGARRRIPEDDPTESDRTDDDQAEFDDDGIDRSGLGEHVTRTGLPTLPEGSVHTLRRDPLESDQPLARVILDDEIAPGGHLSRPGDVPGIVLSLAKDLPAAAAVSVVRIDEEVELVGNSIDPEVDPSMLASVFSGVFRTMQVASGVLADGPLGSVHDVVIEGEFMDLVLRPLGVRYFLMVLEDRRSPQANLAATRMRMAALAPGLTAILATADGED